MAAELVQDAEKAFQRIVRMLNASEQSSVKVRKKLARIGYDDAIMDEAIERARRSGIIDDARYADVLVRSTVSQGKGFRFVRVELEELGIMLEDVAAYQEYGNAASSETALSDFDRAYAFLEAHPPRAKNLRDAAFRKLIGKGYGTDTATSVAHRWSEAQR